MIIEIVGIVAALGAFVTAAFVWLNWKENQTIAEQRRTELQMAADRQAHEQYMEVQRLSLPEPSAELLNMRLKEAEGALARAEADLAATRLADRRRY